MRISDWSSDVCSSDLPDHEPGGTAGVAAGVAGLVVGVPAGAGGALAVTEGSVGAAAGAGLAGAGAIGVGIGTRRSAESRVGKEWVRTGRSWWSPDPEKKQKKSSNQM